MRASRLLAPLLVAAVPGLAHALATCNGSIGATPIAVTPFVAPGDVVRVRVDFTAGPIDDGTMLLVERVRAELDCSSAGPVGVGCLDDGAVVAYAGDASIGTTCAGVVWTSGHAPGASPNQVVFSASPPVAVPKNMPAWCALEFDVVLLGAGGDPTPSIAESAVGLLAGDASCDNGLQSAPAAAFTHPPLCPGCDDGNACTTEQCDRSSGQCETTATLPCDDGLFCNGVETCTGGACAAGRPPCPGPDGDADCAESCDEAARSCTAPDAPGSVCRPATHACDVAEACTGSSAACPADRGLECAPGQECNPATGVCAPAGTCVAEDAICDDTDACTEKDRCTGGVCTGRPVRCDDANPCTTDACARQTGCTTTPVADGGACDDADDCTVGSSCEAGTCGVRNCALTVLQVTAQGVLQPALDVECSLTELGVQAGGNGTRGTCRAKAVLVDDAATAGTAFANAAGGGKPKLVAKLQRRKLGADGRAVLRLKLTRSGRRRLAASADGEITVRVGARIRSGRLQAATSRIVRLLAP